MVKVWSFYFYARRLWWVVLFYSMVVVYSFKKQRVGGEMFDCHLLFRDLPLVVLVIVVFVGIVYIRDKFDDNKRP